MDTINTSATTLKPSDEDKVASLCEWIAKNCDHPITWDQLTEQSNTPHSTLIHLFKVRLKVTPMGYVRRCIKHNFDKSHPVPQRTLPLFPDQISRGEAGTLTV